MEALTLNILGSFQARLGDQEISAFRTNKVQALMVYLAVEATPRRREELMELLWPGMPERSARLNLRQILYHLRNVISNLPTIDGKGEEPVSFIVANRQTIQRNPDANVVIDTERLDLLVEGTISHDHPDLLICQHCHKNLETAVTLYRGNFLEDFYLDDSNEFELWAQINREAYTRKVLDALEVLSTVRTRERRFSEAREFVERQLNIDNLRESAYRQLMIILALAGHREEALSVYENCRRVLVEELAMEPSKRTTETYEQVLAGELSFDTPTARGVRGYELKEEIGRGAYGITHRAIQPAVEREVAVKIIRREYANDPEFIRRFEEEAQIIARLEHPYIVPLYDYWRDPDGVYLVMRFLRGGSLLSALESGPWKPEATGRLLNQLATALASAHTAGIIHRDIKPANILFDDTGNAYLTDFGISKDLAREVDLTREGLIIGTPDYISPEQISDQPVSAQTDIYSLGMVLYEILTGEKPYADSSLANLLQKQLGESVPPLSASRPELSVGFDTVIQKATSKQSADRYTSVLEMAEAFQNVIRGEDGFRDVSMPAITPAVVVTNPYKGLQAFQQADADDYFGRETLVERLITRLNDSRFLALVGPSGSGKSSAVKAGLIPALRRGVIPSQGQVPGLRDWFLTEMVPGSRPLEELELALWPIAVDPPVSLVEPMERDTRGMFRTIRRILPDEPGAQLLLIIDQFEELFTLVEDEERRAFFIDSLYQAIVAPRSPLRVIVTLRADFYDRPLQNEALGKLLAINTEVVLPMSAEELTWAIREPSRRMGVGLEPGLIEVIKADVADQPGALPLLQYTLTELFDRRQNRTMTQAAYHEIGGVRGTLGRRANAIYHDLDRMGQEGTRELFLRLITLGEGVEDTRRRVLRSELEAIDFNSQHQLSNGGPSNSMTGNAVGTVIDAYGSARLLTFDHDPVTRQPTVEVAHEALLREWSQLRGWLDESRADVRNQRLLDQAAKAWNASEMDDSYLLRGARLDLFAGWANNSGIALTTGERDFLDASLSARQARQATEETRRLREVETAQKLAASEQAKAETERQRAAEAAKSAGRFKRLAVVLAGVMGVAVILAIASILFGRQASQNAEEAQANAVLASEQSALAVTREAEALAEAEQRTQAQAQAEQAAEIAFSRELSAAALNSLADDPERSILLALQALEVNHTVAAENSLHQAVLSSRIRQKLTMPGPGREYYLDLSPDGEHLITSGENGALLWDVTAGEIVHQWDIDGWINQSQFTSDGEVLLTADEAYENPEEGIVIVHDVESGEELFTLMAHDSAVRYLALSPDDSLLATGSANGIVRLWDWPETLAKGRGVLLLTLPVERGSIWGLAFNLDGSLVAASSHDGTATVWDSHTGDELYSFNEDDSQILIRVIFSPDGEYLLTAGSKGVVEIWDMKSGQRVSRTDAHASGIDDLDFDASGELVFTVSSDAKAKLWRYSAGNLQEEMNLVGHGARLRAGEFTEDNSHLITSSADGTIRFWDISPHGNEELFTLTGHEGPLVDLDASDDGTRLVSGGRDDLAIVWDASNGQKLFTLADHEGWVNSVDFRPDGQLIATAAEDLTVKLWDAETGELLKTITGHAKGNVGNVSHGVMDVEFSPDGAHLATAGTDGMAKIWDVESEVEIVNIKGHPEGYGLTQVAFSPDGSMLATASDDFQDDGLVKVWDADTGQELYTVGGDRIRIWSVAFSPDGDRLGIADRSGLVDVWLLPQRGEDSNNELVEPELLFSIPVHSSTARGLLFSAEGDQIVTAGIDGKVSFRDSWTGEPLLTIDRPLGYFGTAFSPAGDWLALAGTDGNVYIYALDPDRLTSLAQSRVTRSLTTAECQQYLHMSECPSSSG